MNSLSYQELRELKDSVNGHWYNAGRRKNKFVKAVTENTVVTKAQKIDLLRVNRYSSVGIDIRNGETKVRYTTLRQSLYNLMLLQKHGVREMTRSASLASVKLLKENNLIYENVKSVQITDESLVIEQGAVMVKTYALSTLGEELLNGLSEIGAEIAQKELSRLQKLGIAS